MHRFRVSSSRQSDICLSIDGQHGPNHKRCCSIDAVGWSHEQHFMGEYWGCAGAHVACSQIHAFALSYILTIQLPMLQAANKPVISVLFHSIAMPVIDTPDMSCSCWP